METNGIITYTVNKVLSYRDLFFFISNAQLSYEGYSINEDVKAYLDSLECKKDMLFDCTIIIDDYFDYWFNTLTAVQLLKDVKD